MLGERVRLYVHTHTHVKSRAPVRLPYWQGVRPCAVVCALVCGVRSLLVWQAVGEGEKTVSEPFGLVLGVCFAVVGADLGALR